MGIRPSISLVIGVNDMVVEDYVIKDPRWTAEENWAQHEVVIPPKPDTSFVGKDAASLWTKDKNDAMMHRIVVENVVSAAVGHKDYYEMKRPIQMWEIIRHDVEYGIPEIFGITLDRLPYASQAIYALAAIYPEFQQSGYRILPSLSLEEDSSPDAALLQFGLANLDEPSIQRKKRLVDNQQNYLFFSYDFEFWAEGALDILKDQLGFQIEQRDLKLMLYWQWS